MKPSGRARRPRKPPKIEIVELSARQLEVFAGERVTYPVIAHAGVVLRGRRLPVLVCFGGLAWRFIAEGATRPRCEIWVNVERPDLLSTLSARRTLVRWAQRMLRTAAQLGEPAVFCIRDDEPNSAKLLTLAGLKRLAGDVSITYADGTARSGEMWQWLSSQPSEPPSP